MVIFELLPFPETFILPDPEILAENVSHSIVPSIFPDPDTFDSNADTAIGSLPANLPEPDIETPVKAGQ